MFVPGTRQRFTVPHSLTPFFLAVIAVIASVSLWAVVSTRTVSNDSEAVADVTLTAGSIRSVAYALPEGSTETLYVRRAGSDAPPVAIASFPLVFTLRAHGAASPSGDRIAVVHAGPAAVGAARLTLVDVASRQQRLTAAEVDYLSPVAWSSDGSRLAAVRTNQGGSNGKSEESVVQVDANTGEVLDIARFQDVLQVVPVGYSLDGQRLYIVVVDSSGSSLWSWHGTRLEKLTTFSPGPTRDWSLSPDASRMAFVERLGVGDRSFAGRVLLIATGAVTDIAETGDQVGTAWRPGAITPDFGGPGGSLRLTEPADDGSEQYILPMQWAPDGSMLVATIYSADRDGTPGESESIELLPLTDSLVANTTGEQRERLADEPGARFFGWVRDLE